MTSLINPIPIYRQAFSHLYQYYPTILRQNSIALLITIVISLYWAIASPKPTIQLVFILCYIACYCLIALTLYRHLLSQQQEIAKNPVAFSWLFIHYLVNTGVVFAVAISPLAIYLFILVGIEASRNPSLIFYSDYRFAPFFFGLIISIAISLRLLAGLSTHNNDGLIKAWQRTRSLTFKLISVLSWPMLLVLVAIIQLDTTGPLWLYLLQLLFLILSIFWWLTTLALLQIKVSN